MWISLQNKDNYLSSIFSLLTGNRLLEACNLAVENQDYRLALLLCQSSGGNDSVRAMIRKQLSEWQTSNVSIFLILNSSFKALIRAFKSILQTDKYINADRLKLFTLISGQLTYKLSCNQSQFVNVCENLDWKRQFGLHLWYKCLPINSINDAVIAYEKSVQEGICNSPVPPYIEDSISVKKLEKQNALDTCYNLIKLYCNNTHSIDETIAPLSHSANQLDHRLSWHLASVIQALNYSNKVQNSCLESLNDSYAMQLEAVGLWQWSIFICMHNIDEQRFRFVCNLFKLNNTHFIFIFYFCKTRIGGANLSEPKCVKQQ